MKKGCAPNIHNDLDELERTLAESSGAYMCGKDLTIACVWAGRQAWWWARSRAKAGK